MSYIDTLVLKSFADVIFCGTMCVIYYDQGYTEFFAQLFLELIALPKVLEGLFGLVELLSIFVMLPAVIFNCQLQIRKVHIKLHGVTFRTRKERVVAIADTYLIWKEFTQGIV